MLGAAGVQVPENNLDDLHSSREEDGTSKTVRNKSSQELILPRIDQGVGIQHCGFQRACASLRNFNLEVTELENTQNNALAKLHMLKLGEYEMWEYKDKHIFRDPGLCFIRRHSYGR
ncbi:hypothetical protein Tco_0481030 [Tanacetum coccineum]